MNHDPLPVVTVDNLPPLPEGPAPGAPRPATGGTAGTGLQANEGLLTPGGAAQLFHETYERLAPDFGYETRKASAKPWAAVPEQNRALMVATAGHVLADVLRAAAGQLDALATHDGRDLDDAELYCDGILTAANRLRALADGIGGQG